MYSRMAGTFIPVTIKDRGITEFVDMILNINRLASRLKSVVESRLVK